jgi:glycosyltransferase involved in cell wall biosynthesis
LEVGIVCGSGLGDGEAGRALDGLAEVCGLGVSHCPMPRQLSFGDWRSYRAVQRLASGLGVDVLHGHGAKGGAYARLAARGLKRGQKRVAAFYSPHRGSTHSPPATLMGRVYAEAERRLAPLTDGIMFESRFAARRYREVIGAPPCRVCVVRHGLHRHDFYEPTLIEDAADFVFVGELSESNGLDILLAALAAQRTLYPARVLIVGSGPAEQDFRQLVQKLGLDGKVSFAAPMPARRAFARGRCLVVPSRTEAFPQLVLEAAAAQMPLIAADVGAIPEIVEGTDTPLVRAGDVASLAAHMRAFLAIPRPFLDRAGRLQESVAKSFTVERMAMDVVEFYRAVLGSGEAAEAGQRPDQLDGSPGNSVPV